MAKPETRTTTVRLPRPVYEKAKSIVDKKRESRASTSLNDFIVSAIKAYLKMYERRRIDAAFAGMAGDEVYQKEGVLLAEDFEHSDWEALKLEEFDGGPHASGSAR